MVRTNKYPAVCFECLGKVPSCAGELENFVGKWIVRHKACAAQAKAIDTALATPPATVCPRHGCDLEPATFARFNGCWECCMEADVQARDRQEAVAVATYKMHRDRGVLR